MNKKNLFLLSIDDFFTPQMLKYAILPFIITIIVMYIIFFTIAGIGLDQFGSFGSMDIQSTQTTIQNGIPHTETITAQLEGSAIIQFLMSYTITAWIATFLVYAIGGFFTLYLSIFVAVLVIGFLTPYILKVLQQRHYQDVEMIGYSNIFESLFLVLKWTLTMIALFFLLIPFYFFPLVNIIAFNLPLYYFFHKMMTFDIASNITTREEDNQIKYYNGNMLKLKTVTLYLISLVPFAIFFGAIFYVIYLGHTYFVETRKIREYNYNN